MNDDANNAFLAAEEAKNLAGAIYIKKIPGITLTDEHIGTRSKTVIDYAFLKMTKIKDIINSVWR